MKKRSAYTLVELLTVIAISSVLLTLILFPLFQAFNATKQTQLYADALAASKRVIEKVTKEIGSAVAIRDISGTNGSCTVVVPGRSGTISTLNLPYTKIDIIRPAQGVPSATGGFTDPDSGLEDPTLKGPKGDIVTPVVPGSTITRYAVGLMRPIIPGTPTQVGLYNNPWASLLTATNSNQENLYVLWRFEIQPYVRRLRDPSAPASGTNKMGWFGDTKYFQCDTNGQIIDADDPAFFQMVPTVDYNPTTGVLNATGTQKAARIANWMKTGTIVSPATRCDMIGVVYNTRTKEIRYDGNDPRLFALCQFRPSRTRPESANPMQAVRSNEEADYPSKISNPNLPRIAPDVYRTSAGGWVDAVLRVYPEGYVQSDPVKDEYLTVRHDPATPGYSIFYFDPASGDEFSAGTELFDLDTYDKAKQAGLNAPFTRGLQAAVGRSNWPSLGSAQVLKDAFVPMHFDTRKGMIETSFPIGEFSDPVKSATAYNPNLFPVADTGVAQNPTQDNGSGVPYSPLTVAAGAFYEVNRVFNRVYNEHPSIKDQVKRFIDLRVAPYAYSDGSVGYGPLHPTQGYRRFMIVPGSDVIYGPDQNPGPGFGLRVRYTRTNGTPGPNQYRINYVNQQEPETSGTIDYTLLGLTAADLTGFDPNVYDPSNFVSATIQPRFKVGYIELNSDPNSPIPALVGGAAGEPAFLIQYRVQSTKALDTIAVDYSSRQGITVQITIRNYASGNNVAPQSVTQTMQANVRTYQR